MIFFVLFSADRFIKKTQKDNTNSDLPKYSQTNSITLFNTLKLTLKWFQLKRIS